MQNAHIRWVIALAAVLAAFPGFARAEQFEEFGDYIVHYSAFTTDTLPRNIAKNYGIVRSKNRAMLNISVLRKVMGTAGQSVRASVDATATNLNGQLRQLKIRELNEQTAVYYIAETSISSEEVLTYKVSIVPEQESAPLDFQFQQQFFTD